MPVPPHLTWLRPVPSTLRLACGKRVATFRFDHLPNAAILSAWAKHFRQNYCRDEDLDDVRAGTPHSRSDYLTHLKFPSRIGFGPGVRSGDFTEILLSDYLEFRLGYTIPRLRWCSKDITDESKKGCDIFGYKFVSAGTASPQDELVIVEGKSKFSPRTAPPIQNAIEGSSKDHIRIGMSLNACVERSKAVGKRDDMKAFQRFQNPIGSPFLSLYRAGAAICDSSYDPADITTATSAGHPNATDLEIIVIQGPNMMRLVHALYERAAREA
jgi:hypothetical protein